MLTIESKAYVGAALEDEITEFLLTCTDARYQSWWPGTHLAFHVISRGRPDHTGDVVVELTPRHGGVAVRHTITAGWAGAGRVLDPLWRL